MFNVRNGGCGGPRKSLRCHMAGFGGVGTAYLGVRISDKPSHPVRNTKPS